MDSVNFFSIVCYFVKKKFFLVSLYLLPPPYCPIDANELPILFKGILGAISPAKLFGVVDAIKAFFDALPSPA